MSRLALTFLLLYAPVLALPLFWLGIATLPANPLGWVLVMTGAVYVIGLLTVLVFRRERFFESLSARNNLAGERNDRSFWFIALVMMVCFFLPPVEFLWIPPVIPRADALEITGVILVLLGAGLFAWARRALGGAYSGHISVKTGQKLVRNGPYRFIRHPGYAGYGLIALGISLGYSSLIGIAAFVFLFMPATIARIRKEEAILAGVFGAEFDQYNRQTARLIPGVW